MHDTLTIAGREFGSRLLLGTGKYDTFETMREAVAASGTEIVTVAVRRIDFDAPGEDITSFLPEEVLLLPNTSGCETADEAVRSAKLARAGGLPDWVKLEVIPDPRYLLPDPVETLKAAARLVEDGFTVLPYVFPDPVLAKKLEEVGCATVMPLAAPIGSGRGLKLRDSIRIIVEQAEVPVVVDAGLGAHLHGLRRVRRGGVHGDGRRGRARQHGHRASGRPGRHGRGFPPRGRGRPHGLPCGCHGGAGTHTVEPGRRDGLTVDVNGREQELAPGATVATLLARLGLEAGYALVERNGEPVERARYADVELEDADRLVVARPVAGG